MNNPTISLNGITYTALNPKMALWREAMRFKSERKEKFKDIQQIWDQVEPLNSDESLQHDENTVKKLAELLSQANIKVAENRQFDTDGMINIIALAFNMAPEKLNELPLEDLGPLFSKIDEWLIDIYTGRAKQIPNGKTLTAK